MLTNGNACGFLKLSFSPWFSKVTLKMVEPKRVTWSQSTSLQLGPCVLMTKTSSRLLATRATVQTFTHFRQERWTKVFLCVNRSGAPTPSSCVPVGLRPSTPGLSVSCVHLFLSGMTEMTKREWKFRFFLTKTLADILNWGALQGGVSKVGLAKTLR